MQDFRNKIDSIDGQILMLLKERFDIAKSIGNIKKQSKTPVILDQVREKEILDNLKSKKLIDDIIIEEIWRDILYLSRCVQKDVINQPN